MKAQISFFDFKNFNYTCLVIADGNTHHLSPSDKIRMDNHRIWFTLRNFELGMDPRFKNSYLYLKVYDKQLFIK